MKKKKMNVFEKAMQNKSFRIWLKKAVIEKINNDSRLNGDSYVYDDFCESITDGHSFYDEIVTAEEKSKAMSLHDREQYDYVDDLFEKYNDEILSFNADCLVDSYCEDDNLYKAANIDEAADILSGYLFTVSAFSLATGGLEYEKERKQAHIEEVKDVLAQAQKKNIEIYV